MGQRSQIYIRWHVTDHHGTYHEGLIARYFSWNFGIRMISRTKSILKEIQDEFLDYPYLFSDPSYIKKLKRYCDVNFDMQSIEMSSDIIEEVKEQFPDNTRFLFEQDNNNGQLFIDVSESEIKYGFMEFFDCNTVMDADKYMEWDRNNSGLPNWHVPDKYVSISEIQYTEENIKAINKIASLMTIEEIHEFIDHSLMYMEEIINGESSKK